MSIPLAATSVQINSRTSFFYKHKKTFKRRQRGCPRKKGVIHLVLLYLETLQVVFPFIRFTITMETNAGQLVAFAVRT